MRNASWLPEMLAIPPLAGAENNVEVGTMAEIIIIVLIIAMIAFFVVMARRPPKHKHTRKQSTHKARGRLEPKKPRTKKDELEQLRKSKQFWGVEIHQPGCAAAAKLTGKQYPIESAPELPLEDCGAARCSCLYMGLKDRRVMRRRLTHERRDELRFDPEKSDRRSHKDRRKSIEKWRDRD